MGADLITYIVVGPETIVMTDEMLTKIKASSVEMEEQVKQYLLDEGKTEGREEFLEWYEDAFGEPPEDVEDASNHLSATNRLKVAEEFIKGWPDFGRDTNVRFLNEKEVIVVAGDMSWGDSPDGAGYTAIDYVYKLKLDEILGLR